MVPLKPKISTETLFTDAFLVYQVPYILIRRPYQKNTLKNFGEGFGLDFLLALKNIYAITSAFLQDIILLNLKLFPSQVRRI